MGSWRRLYGVVFEQAARAPSVLLLSYGRDPQANFQMLRELGPPLAAESAAGSEGVEARRALWLVLVAGESHDCRSAGSSGWAAPLPRLPWNRLAGRPPGQAGEASGSAWRLPVTSRTAQQHPTLPTLHRVQVGPAWKLAKSFQANPRLHQATRIKHSTVEANRTFACSSTTTFFLTTNNKFHHTLLQSARHQIVASHTETTNTSCFLYLPHNLIPILLLCFLLFT